jgi:hypothetical protein
MATVIEVLFCAVAGALAWLDGAELFVAWYSGPEPMLWPAGTWAVVARMGSLLLAMLAMSASLLVRCTW